MAAGKLARILSYRLKKNEPHQKRYVCFCFCFSNVCDHSPFVRPTFLKLGCTVNFHVLYFMVAFVCLVENSSFMLIRSCHFELGLLTLTPVPSPPTHIGTVISPTQPLVYKTTQKCSRKFTKRWTYTWGSLVWVLHTYVDPFNNDVVFSKALKSAVFLFFTFYFWKEFYQIANIEP